MSDAERVRARVRVARVLRFGADDPGSLIVLTGPTASGKSEVAMEVAKAIGGEVVIADSVQLVRGFDIGSGKPTLEERREVPHHLVDALDPLEDADAARFAELAEAALADVVARGRRPILCGGTFLWIRALLFGLVDAPAADEARRRSHRELADREGKNVLHDRLRAVDPEAAARLHPNDVVRVSRALEVFETTGRRLSELQAAHGFRSQKRAAHLFAIERTSEELTARIQARVSNWLAGGWIAETSALIGRGYGEARAMGSVGYREVAAHLRGEIARADLETAIVRSTRVYARRQRTFLKQAPVEWL